MFSAQQQPGGHFVGSKFYCPHAHAGGNQRIRIREKTLEFSTLNSVICTVSIVNKND